MRMDRQQISMLIIAFILICTLGFVLIVKLQGPKKSDDEIAETHTETVLPQSTDEPINTPAPVWADGLQSKLNDFTQNVDGEWAVYWKNLYTGETVSVRDRKMISASLIKLFIMAKTFDAIENETLAYDEEVQSLLKKMITVSDNTSSNILVEKLGNGDFKKGMAIVNDYAISIGCNNTEQQRDMLDFREKPVEGENYTSVENCGILLEKIYTKTCVSPKYDAAMLDFLCGQTRRGKIPAGLPEGTKTANKTGELSTVENDVAIVFSEKAVYILCVMVNKTPDTAQTRSDIAALSKLVWTEVQDRESSPENTSLLQGEDRTETNEPVADKDFLHKKSEKSGL